MAETRESSARPFLSKLKGGGRSQGVRQWLADNWAEAAMLLIILFLALFLRSYFGYSITTQNGYPVSGGSDSYYWERIIGYSSETGKQLYWDPLSNFPDGIRNPRPPLFSMGIVVPAVFIQNAFSSLESSWSWTLMWSTAFWGALTVIPVYFIGKESFNRRVGLAAAFFLAVMPSHIQRSVLSDADHDSFILFFIVLTFYFLLKAAKTQQHRQWVQSWRSWSSIKSGFRDYFATSRRPVLYSLLAGTSFGAVIMAWVGFGYAAVIILAYYLIQVMINKFKNVDSMSITVIIALSLGFGYLISFPVYYYQSLIPVRFDVPVYLWLASLLLGILFVVSRDFPWTLTLPSIFTVLAIGILIVDIIDPELAQAILSGQGYFATNKLYSTIAEARAPQFSELALGFGVVTFFMSLIGLAWAVMQIPKHTGADYIFLVVWLGASIFMAISAGRFMFNAAPAFALSAAWVLIIIVDKLDFLSVRKSILGASGSYLRVLRKSVKIRHVVGILFLAFLVVLPNVWYSVDAGIPSETKPSLDKQIYYSLPSFMRPSGYDKYNGSDWYLGAFGYSLPLAKYYFPAAWDWFAGTDADILPEESRPAFVAWWDYGFEAIEAGQHPTVADNFQNGYQLTGNVLMAQSEEDAIALFAFRLISTGVYEPQLKPAIFSLFDKYGVSVDRMNEVLYGSTDTLATEILSDPTTYGPMDTDISPTNARIVTGRVALIAIGTDKLVALYQDLVDITGWDIRYFMVDSRMLPTSGTNTGIFYAPAKLSDRRIDTNSIPIDFYDIKAVDQYGREYALSDVTSSMTIVDYKIVYKDMFYDSMFYRAMCGYSPAEIGKTNDGLPGGSSGSATSAVAAPGWGLTHFRLVYRTAYYNPWPSNEVWKHRDAWTAVSLAEATQLKKQIQAGTIQGVIDDSTSSYYSAGATFLKYYAGAYVNGTLTTEQGYPVSGVRVTIQDEYGIPHDSTLTDASGHYAILAPFGNLTLSFSTGSLSNTTMRGSNTITTMQFNVTDDQAMRVRQDLNGDGIYDYVITKDYVMKGTQATGDIFWDLNGDGNYTAGTDELISDAVAYATDLNTSETFNLNASEGSFDMLLPPGAYSFYAVVNGVNLTISELTNITAGVKSIQKLALKPAQVTGTLIRPDGSEASGVELTLNDLAAEYKISETTDSHGNFTFDRLVYGGYALTTSESGSIVFAKIYSLQEGQTSKGNVTIYPSSEVSFSAFLGSLPAPYTVYSLTNYFDPTDIVTGQTDAFGNMQMQLPKGVWTLYMLYHNGVGSYAATAILDTSVSDSVSAALPLQPAVYVSGNLRAQIGTAVSGAYVTFESSNGARVSYQADIAGGFDAQLPADTYNVTSVSYSGKRYLSQSVAVYSGMAALDLRMTDGYTVEGTIWLDKDAISGASASDLGRLAQIKIVDPQGRLFTTQADINGTYTAVLPQSSAVTISVANPGYSGWHSQLTLTKNTEDLNLLATPDNVSVSGQVTYDGIGIRGVTVAFMPDSLLLIPVYVTTGAEGFYEASLPPASYKVVVNQDTNPMGGERYMYQSGSQAFLASGVGYAYDVRLVERVEMYGFVLGGSTTIKMTLQGPEVVNLNLTSLNYSVWVLPGDYGIYAVSTLGGLTYSNISNALVTYEDRNHDIDLQRAYELTGTITIGSEPPGKQVTVTATSSTGEVVGIKSTSQGFYSIKLPPGTYSVSYLLETTVVEGVRTHYIEFYDDQTITMVSGTVFADASLARRYDNSTYSGTVYGPNGVPEMAFVKFIANTGYGESASFYTSVDGKFSVGVQPGSYTVYATRLQDKRVSLSTMTILRNTPKAQDINLTSGWYLTGVSLVSGAGTPLDISVANGTAKMHVISDQSGAFSVLLPSANYTLAASTTTVENGLSIDYSGSTAVPVNGSDTYLAFPLTRSTKYGVSVSWNRSETPTALPGANVSYAFTVTNTGNIKDTFLITFIGTGFNVTFSDPEITLDFGVNNQAIVTAQVNASGTLAAGDTKVSCLVRSRTSSSTRSNLDLYLNISPVYRVQVASENLSEPVSSETTYTKFKVSNTGNVADQYDVQVANLDILNSLGWTAEIVNQTTKAAVAKVNVSAHGYVELMVKFTSMRSSSDPTALASVLVYSTSNPGISSYGNVQVMLPDLVIGPGDLQATRGDVTYERNTSILYIDLGLVVAVAVLAAMFFYLRKKRGLSTPKGGAKK